MSTPVRSYWKPSQGLDFGRVALSADHGRVRESGEVFASLCPGLDGRDLVQVTVHKEAQFAAVLNLTMTVDDAIAVIATMQRLIHEVLAQGGQTPRPAAPVRVDGSGRAA